MPYSRSPVGKDKAGFSLIELMVTIAIFAILASIATPNVIQWLRNAQFNSSVMDVKNAVEEVRMHAVKNNAEAAVIFDGTNTFRTKKLDRRTGTAPEVSHQVPEDVTISSTLGVDGELTYNSRGMLENPGTDVTITVQNAALGLTNQIEVDGAGSVRIQ